jgi:Chondroitinase B
MIIYMKKQILVLSLLLIANVSFCKSYLIHNEQEFDSIHDQIKPGDEIVIANGTYTPWSLVANTNGTAAQPITIKAQTTGKVIFSGDVVQPLFQLTGSYTILRGIHFIDCTLLKAEKQTGILVELKGSKHCRVTECVFSRNVTKAQYMPIVVVSGKGESNQVDHCTFTGNVDNQELQVKVTKDISPLYTLIENNLFRDKIKVSWQNSNGGECVQIGQDPILLGTMQSKSTVRENRFIRCNGEPEVISNKSSNNMYVKNYFEDCDGELVMRGGHDCVIDSNTIKGGNSGIRVNGTGHVVTHNDISNIKTGIRLMYGMAGGKNEIGFYIAASDCVIKYNHIENATTGIFIGDSKNADWTGKFDTVRYPSRVMQDVAPSNNTVSDNIFIKTQTNLVKQ